jgi:predicted HNH restriction endonuclease
MRNSKSDIDLYFHIGDEVQTGSGKETFYITAIDEKYVTTSTSMEPDSRQKGILIESIVILAKLINDERHYSIYDISSMLSSVGKHHQSEQPRTLGLAKLYRDRRPRTIEDIHQDFEDITSIFTESSALDNLDHHEKDTPPAKITLQVTEYQRNPAVVKAARRRADGTCEKCHKLAPFMRKSDGVPYLEVHHVKPLSRGGLDTIDNAIAVCPNCHREIHDSINSGECTWEQSV